LTFTRKHAPHFSPEKTARNKLRNIFRSKHVLYEDRLICVASYVSTTTNLPAGHRGITIVEIADLHLREPMYKEPSKPYSPDRLDKLLGWRGNDGKNRLDRLLGRNGKPELRNTNHFDRLIKKQLEHTIAMLQKLPALLQENGKSPDVVLLTGDFISRNSKDITPQAQVALSNLFTAASIRAYVLGNTDYAKGSTLEERARETGNIIQKIDSAGFANLTNALLQVKVGGASVSVVGVDDYNKGKPRQPAIPSTSEPNLVLVALHNLDALTKECLKNASAIFSGHTHGGEFRLLFGLFTGFPLLRKKGTYKNLNGQTNELKIFPEGHFPLSLMSWGVGRYLFWRTGVAKGHINVVTLVPEGQRP